MVNPLLLLCAVITTQRRVVVGMFVWFGCVWCWVPEFWFSRTDSFERKPALLLVQTKTNGFHYPWVLSVCPNIRRNSGFWQVRSRIRSWIGLALCEILLL